MRVILWGDDEELAEEMNQYGISFQIIRNPSKNDIRRLANRIREHRDTLGTSHTPRKGWKFNEISRLPIIEIEDDIAYPAFYIENMGILERSCWMHAIEDKQKTDDKKQRMTKLKLKIKNKLKKSDKINISLESQARINVTMLRLVNGVDIYSIMKGWGEKEKAAALITWRLAQHNKANDLRLMAEMMENKAQDADPYVNRQTDRT